MKFKGIIFILVLVSFCKFSFVSANTDRISPSATLPLDELLTLHRKAEKSEEKEKPIAPVSALINRIEIKGRILLDRLDATIHYTITVLDEAQWISLPLMQLEGNCAIYELPDIPQASVTTIDNSLTFLTKKSGPYQFSLKCMIQAEMQNTKRTVRLQCAEAPMKILRLEVDEHLFSLISPTAHRENNEYILYPDQNTFTIQWQQSETITNDQKNKGPTPSIEPIIPKAIASLVTTAEGIHLQRTIYYLQFEGNQQLTIQVPEGQQLMKVFLNRMALPFTVSENKVDLIVNPPRAGEKGGILELLIRENSGNFFLAGKIVLRFSQISWPINVFFVQAHLPDTYNYEWKGGSLAEGLDKPNVTYSYQLPTPGKELLFQQFLVLSSMPTVSIDYTVDLSGLYYQ